MVKIKEIIVDAFDFNLTIDFRLFVKMYFSLLINSTSSFVCKKIIELHTLWNISNGLKMRLVLLFWNFYSRCLFPLLNFHTKSYSRCLKNLLFFVNWPWIIPSYHIHHNLLYHFTISTELTRLKDFQSHARANRLSL